MKILIAVVCVLGIAFVSSAPVEEIASISPEAPDSSIAEEPQQKEERAALELHQTPEHGMEIEPIAERAAENPSPTSVLEQEQEHERAAERTSIDDLSNIEVRGILPSTADVIKAIEKKYFTEDGISLIRTFIPGA